MTLIASSPDYIHQESIDKDSPLSEDLGKRMGASINYVLENFESIPMNFYSFGSINTNSANPLSRSIVKTIPFDAVINGLNVAYYSPVMFNTGFSALSSSATLSVIINSTTVCSVSISKSYPADTTNYHFYHDYTSSTFGDYGISPSVSLDTPISVNAGETITVSLNTGSNPYYSSTAYDINIMLVKAL